VDLRLADRTRIHLVTAFLVAASLACALAAVASAAPVRGTAGASFARIGRAPVIPAGARPAGTLPRSAVIDASVALTPRDPEAMAAYAQAVSTPGSPLYHHYISVARFAQRFGPTAADVASVRAALQARGLHPGPLAANRLSIDVTASAAELSSALSTSFKRYRVPSGRSAFANTAAPQLPSSVAGLVRGVIGLDTLQVPTPAGVVRRPATGSHAGSRATLGARAAPGSSGACRQLAGKSGNTADQIASAYGLNDLYAAGDGGARTTIALFELEPYSAGDIAGYQHCYGTSTAVTNVNVDGGPGSGSGTCIGCEATLDIEDLIGLAPQASILVYQGPNTGAGAYDTYRTIVSQNRAAVISTSWGLCEPQQGSGAAAAENDLFTEAVAQGQSVFAASGDNGVQDCQDSTNPYDPTLSYRTVDDPASQPWVTGAGGTSLTSNGPPPVETVWNNSAGAGGGGVSSFWGAPSYQSGFTVAQSSVRCLYARSTACREVPDVSADADPTTGYDIFLNGRWYEMGGTSAAAPTWAALAALADSSSACGGRTIGFANPALYQAASAAYSSYFNDVSSGNNSNGGLSGFSAGGGYDMATGLGSPKGAALAAAMCNANAPAPPPPSAAPAPTQTTTTAPPPVVTLNKPAAQKARVGQPVHVQLHATDSAGQTLSWRSAGLPPGVSISKTTGLISGTPTKAGKATATVTVSDTSGASVRAFIPWNVAGRPTITGGLTVKRGKPSLALRVIAGINAPAVQSIVIVPSSQIRFARRSRDLARGITVRNSSGHKLASAARLRSGDLVVTLRSRTVRTASLRVTVPALTLVKPKKRPGKQHPAAQQKPSVTVVDVTAVRSALSLR
jgi:pro-kumamolisin-like protein/putative Ig domain-containing protein